jgi:hypothetical protein
MKIHTASTTKNVVGVAHPRLVRLLTWLTGRKPDNRREDYKQGGMVCLRKYPAAIWEYAPTGDFYSITVQVVAAPNALHRGLQCLAFGVRYRLLPNAERIHGGAGQSKTEDASTPLDGASC